MCLSLNLSSTYRRATEVLPTHPSPSKTTLKLYPVPTTGLAIIPGKQLSLALKGIAWSVYLLVRDIECPCIREPIKPGSLIIFLYIRERWPSCTRYDARSRSDMAERWDDDDRTSIPAALTLRNQLFCSVPLRATIGAFFVAFVI